MTDPFAHVADTNLANWYGNPEGGKKFLMRDLERLGRTRAGAREERETSRRSTYIAGGAEAHSGRHGYGFMQPGHREPQYRAENPNQYMIDAIMRDQAVQAYDLAQRRAKVSTPDPHAGGLAWSALQGTPRPKAGDIQAYITQRKQNFKGVVKPGERLGRGQQFSPNQAFRF